MKKKPAGNFIVPSLLTGVSLLSCTPGSIKERPNFIFILADDLGWADLSCYGSAFYETPHLDRLAAEGLRFTNACAACPVSSPTRASIMTGKYPARLGLTDWIPGRQNNEMLSRYMPLSPPSFRHELPLEEFTIAEALKTSGWSTFFAGKWHLGMDSAFWPEFQGFDTNIGGWSRGSPVYPNGYFSPYHNPRLPDGPEGEYLTDRLTDECIRFLEQEHEKPFFLFLSFYTVHNPLQAKPGTIEKYRRKANSLGYTDQERFVRDHPWMKEFGPGDFRERLIQDEPVYAAMIEHMDENIGRLLEALEQSGSAKNTIVFFTSDNGGLSTSEGSNTSNLPLRAGKGWLYEGGIRVPLIVRWPGMVKPGEICGHPVTSTDFYPSILELAGLQAEPRQHSDGRSFAGLLTGKMSPEEHPLFWHYPHYSNQGGRPGGAIRDGRFKLIWFYETGSIELYDLEEDPGEKSDLSDSLPEIAGSMKEKLDSWLRETGASMPAPNPVYQPFRSADTR